MTYEPQGFDTSSETGRELYAYANSTGKVWQYFEASFRNLEPRWRTGAFDSTKALKLLSGNARTAAMAYTREYGLDGTWFYFFPPASRDYVATTALAYFVRELELGNSWTGKE